MSNETREPTEAEIAAVHAALTGPAPAYGGPTNTLDRMFLLARHIASAMLAAAPQQPAGACEKSGGFCQRCGYRACMAQQPAGDDLRRQAKSAVQASRGWPADLHPGPAVDAVLALIQPAPPALGEVADAVERIDTVRRLINDGRTEIGAITDVFGTSMNRRDKLSADLRTILAALQARPASGGEGVWPEKWSGPCTVGNMIANLSTLPPDMPIYTAYHVPMDDQPSLLKVKRPTLSRERVDGTNIKTGDESIPYSAVIWSQPRDPQEALSQPAPEGEWRPIETAPDCEDGVLIVDATKPSPAVGVARFTDGKWRGYDHGYGVEAIWPTPTHWRPLPEPPALTPATGGEA